VLTPGGYALQPVSLSNGGGPELEAAHGTATVTDRRIVAARLNEEQGSYHLCD
jgi:hypothetical protein